MVWKEREREIGHATSMIRKQQARSPKKGARMQDEAVAERVARLRALETDGTCGGCRGLKIEYENRGNLVDVVLRCRLGGSPLNLHRLEVTPLGEMPKCEYRIPFEE